MSKHRKPAISADAAKRRKPQRGSVKITALKEVTARTTISGRTAVSRKNTKLATMIAMLRSAEGTTVKALTKATGWQAHSVRGAMSGAIKKKRGLTVTSVKTGGVRTYQISA